MAALSALQSLARNIKSFGRRSTILGRLCITNSPNPLACSQWLHLLLSRMPIRTKNRETPVVLNNALRYIRLQEVHLVLGICAVMQIFTVTDAGTCQQGPKNRWLFFFFYLVICNTEQGLCWIEGQDGERYQRSNVPGTCVLRHTPCVWSDIFHTQKRLLKIWTIAISNKGWFKLENEWPTFCPNQLCNEATLSKFTTTHTNWPVLFWLFSFFKPVKKDENAKNTLRDG